MGWNVLDVALAVRQQEEWRRVQEWALTLIQGVETREALAAFDRVSWEKYIWILPVEADRTMTKLSSFA